VLTGQAADVPGDPERCQVVAIEHDPLTRRTDRAWTGRTLDVLVSDAVKLRTFIGRRRTVPQ